MRLPAEWEPQQAIWLSWPVMQAHWNRLEGDVIQQKWAEITATISHTQTVCLNTSEERFSSITTLLREAGADLDQVTLHHHPNNDVWCRDHGAIFVEDEGNIIATDWQFNGWGGNFSPWDLDNAIPQQMAQAQNLPCRSHSEILEGGAIESNGAGTILTTEAVLLNPNRNPHLDRAGVEAMLASGLGATNVLWLNEGIVGDDTGGHIDDIARYIAPDRILLSSDPTGPNAQLLAENYRLLQAQTTDEIILLPMPEACEIPGWRLPTLPASYVNFLITNETVLVPTFRQKTNDDRALGLIAEHFPTRQIIGIDSLDIVSEGGALHCISMQEPLHQQ